MQYARMALFGMTALIAGAGLAGCLNFPGTLSLPAQPRPTPPTTPAPELRIPADAVAAAPEIPIVPLPFPPADRPADRKPFAAQPVATTPSALQPAPLPDTIRTDTAAPSALPAAPQPADSRPGSPAGSPPPIATTAATAPLLGNPMRRLQQQAAERYANMDSYIVRLTRRENVNGKDKPQEVMLFKFRKEPWSVYFRWLDGEGQGREVIYVKGQNQDKLVTLLAAGDMPLAPAGKRLALPVDSIFVRNASRHPITEAGIGASIGRLGMLLDAVEQGNRRWGTLNDLGAQSRPEFSLPAHAVEQVIPPGAEKDLPGGGRRTYWFDPESRLPLLVQTRDDRGREVEYYYYSHLLYPVKLDDDDFNPDKLWAPQATKPSTPAARQ